MSDIVPFEIPDDMGPWASDALIPVGDAGWGEDDAAGWGLWLGKDVVKHTHKQY